MRKLNSLVSTHRDLRKDGHTFAKRYSLTDKDVRVEDLLGWEFKGQRSCYIMALITRRGTRDRVQDIVSANGDIGIARPLASTTVRMKSLINHDGITITLPFGKVMVSIGSGKVMVPDRKWQERKE